MKKLIGSIAFMVLSSLLIIMITAHTSAAQMSTCKSDIPGDENPAGKEKAYINKINMRAMRQFKDQFRNVSNEDWRIEKDGLIAYFKLGESACWVYYDLKGNWLHTMIAYPEDKLSKDIRALVKSTYYDCQINGVREIRSPGSLIYVVQLEDETSFKSVRVDGDGGMDLISTLDKS
ncbi:MAG TPA: hypothetical protein VE035_16205 [Puia sp.]|nr:hypothetical protein [Puia sp.]